MGVRPWKEIACGMDLVRRERIADQVAKEIETMGTDDTYNGWANYETWAVSLWIDNEFNSYQYWQERARSLKQFDVDEGTNLAQSRLADLLKEEFGDAGEYLLEQGKAQASVWSDLLHAALGEVNWYEIAGNMLED